MNDKAKAVHPVPMLSLTGAIRQKQVPAMWHRLWEIIFDESRHVHLSFRDESDELTIHCWNSSPRSACRSKPNRVCLDLDPSSDEYIEGPGKIISEWIPLSDAKLRELF